MKKILFTALTAVVALSGFAIEKPAHHSAEFSKTAVFTQSVQNRIEAQPLMSARLTSARKVAGDASSIAGDWIFSLGDYYMENNTASSLLVEYSASVSGSVVTFADPLDDYPTFYGVYDDASSTIAFKKQILYQNASYDYYQAPFYFDYALYDLVYQDQIKGTYDFKEGTISFEPDNGLDFPIYKTGQSSEESIVGYLGCFDLESASKKDNIDKWYDAGYATLYDPWVLPACDVNQHENPYQVPLQQNAVNKKRYRLVDPYHIGPAVEFNSSTTAGYIVFDVSDPNNVVFEKSLSGFANAEAKITQFYCYNELGSLMETSGLSAAEIIKRAENAGQKMNHTILKDGVITLGSYTEGRNTVFDANFGMQDKPDGGYGWTGADMTGKIVLPDAVGIESVSVEDSFGSPVYYNLQGVRVSEPASGIFIRVQGNISTKVILK